MPKHYRPAGKKKEGNAAKYVTRSQAVKHLQVSLPVFRKLCILKGVFPREPKKKVKGNHHSYYHTKDIMFLKYEPILETLRDIRSYDKKVKKAESKKNRDHAERLLTRKPKYHLERLVQERYPKFVDALRDLDDCLSMVHLFAALPAVDKAIDGEKIPVARVHTCRRLSYEWQGYISRTHKLRKTFIAVKGIYYQAAVDGQKITWLTPHALQQVLPDVDYKVLLTFLEFYETLLASVNNKLYQSISVQYPPILDPRLEALAAELYALARYFSAQGSSLTSTSDHSSDSDLQKKESELRMSELHHQLPSNEPGALMHLIEDAANEDEEDADTRECKNLFKNMKFYLSREVPRESLLFVIPAFGGTVSWEGEGAPFDESDQSITHQVVDRPTQGRKFLSREYVQPQWVYDCVNQRIVLPTEEYMPGRVPPPHLSPFVDNEAEGHVPDYAAAIELLKAAARKDVRPLPGMGREDLGDPNSMLSVIDRAEDIVAMKRKKKMSSWETQYLKDIKSEVKGATDAATVNEIEGSDAEGDTGPDSKQIAEDNDSMSKLAMPRRKRGLYEAMQMGNEKKRADVGLLKERKKKIDEANKKKKSA